MFKSDLVATRNAVPEDINLIFASWLRGLYYGDSWFSLMKKQTFMTVYHAVLQGILAKPETIVKVACLKEDHNVILGYAVFNSKALHWVFVKKEWRKIGIAKDLVPSELKVATHLTKTGVSLLKQKDWEFDPFKI